MAVPTPTYLSEDLLWLCVDGIENRKRTTPGDLVSDPFGGRSTRPVATTPSRASQLSLVHTFLPGLVKGSVPILFHGQSIYSRDFFLWISLITRGGFHFFLNGKIKITVQHAIVAKGFIVIIYSTEWCVLVLLILLDCMSRLLSSLITLTYIYSNTAYQYQ